MKETNDYFKHTSRTLLTEEQKRKTIKVIERGCQYLGRMSKEHKYEEIKSKNGTKHIYTSPQKMVYLSRWGNLVKGYIQPKYLYRYRRHREIFTLAYLIARDTGADFIEVKNMFFKLMPEYIGAEYP